MKARTIPAFLLICLGSAALVLAADSNLGTWKLNEAKSKIGPGAPKNTTVTYTAAGDMVKVTVDGVDSDGKPAHSEWTGKYDGKDYPVTGDPASDMGWYKRINDRTVEFARKKDGKVRASGKVVVSADGKSRTVTVHGTNAKGEKISMTAVYDKE
jgi:hypothetical protein